MPPDELRKLAAIAGRWGLSLRAAQRVRKIWRLETDQGEFCLKRSILNATDQLFVQNVLEYLESRGFQAGLPCLRNTAGVLSTDYGGLAYVLYPWRRSREADLDRAEDLDLAVGVLTDLQARSTGFIPYRNDPDRVRWGLWPQIFAARRAQLAEFGRRAAARARSSPFCARYSLLLPYYYAEACRTLALLAASPYQALCADGVQHRGICHHDCSGRNLLIDEQGRATLVDFDYCLADLRLHDLANLLLRLLRHNHWRPEVAAGVLALFDRYQPLDDRERTVLYPLLLWPQDFWQVGLQFFLEELPWSLERFNETLRRKTEDRAERLAFLEWYEKEHWRPT